ncbi:hypothetical protein NCCP2716_27830 [Sporosarcina sp. NCCP-2716]|uniref:phage tail tape measure protein n=1 Tax=Sporosarcina sp. NCCP-2716 TaxID=2943679 RepID=UPI00204137DA|nr:phage tail tape measure protein [Sporosarcina sp. NCCP-2716]GKV70285.1 hypothetical protein NCCP2716_27830 [Sporosarcina sp. NCCP-2716]
MAKSLRQTTMKVKVDVEAKELDAVDERLRSTAKSAEALEHSAKKTDRAVEDTGKTLKKTSDAAEQLDQSNKRVDKSTENTGKSMKQTAIEGKKNADALKDQSEESERTASALEKLSHKGTLLRDTFAGIGAAAVTRGMYDLGKQAIITGKEFDQGMSAVKAVAGATNADFKAMREQAIQVGADTTKSAKEVSDAQLELAKSGMSAKETMAAIPGAISASTAAGEDMAMTVGVMTAALNGFQLEASASAHVADVLAEAANGSKADILDMGYAFKYAATPANTLGIQLEELSAATMIMTNAGLAGEQAGTSLRASLIRLVDSPEKASKAMEKLGVEIADAKGNMRPFTTIINELRGATEGMGNAQKLAAMATIFGTEAATGMVSIIDSAPGTMEKFTKSLQESDGASAKAAETMTDNYYGALEELEGTIESISINVSDVLTPTVQGATEILSGLGDRFNDLSPSARSMVVWGTVVAGGVLPATVALFKVVGAVRSISTVMSGANAFFASYRTQMQMTGAQATVTAGQVERLNRAMVLSRTPVGGTIKGAKPVPGPVVAASKGTAAKAAAPIAKGGGKALPIIGTAIAASSLIGMSQETAGQDVGGFAGSLAAGFGGAKVGAAIGTLIAPGIGTAIGSAVGGIAGSVAGVKFGSDFGDYLQEQWPKISKKAKNWTEKNPIAVKSVMNTSPAGVDGPGPASISPGTTFKAKGPLNDKVTFDESVSKSTAKAYASYKKFTDKATVELQYLANSGDVLSKKASDSIAKNFSSSAKVLEDKLEKSAKSSAANLNSLVESGFLGKKEFSKIEKEQSARLAKQKKTIQDTNASIQKLNEKMYNESAKITKRSEDEIAKIKAEAAKKGRSLTLDEQKKITALEEKAATDRKRVQSKYKNEILQLQEQQNKTAVKTLSKSAKEQRTILTTLQHESSSISAKQAADVVKQSVKARDGAVKEANKKYKDVVAAADAEYYENGTITKKQHDDIIAKAKAQRDGAVTQAEDMHQNVVKQAKLQAQGHLDQVDWETGQALSKWQLFKVDLARVVNSVTGGINKVLDFFNIPKIPEWNPAGYTSSPSAAYGSGASTGSKGTAIAANARGTSSFAGGHSLVGEEGVELAYKPFGGSAQLLGANGPEVANLDAGTRILNHRDTMSVLNGGIGAGLTLPGYAKGNSSIADFASSAVSGVKKAGSAIGDFASDAVEWMMHPVESAKKLFGKFIPFSGNDVGGLGTGILTHMRDGAANYFKEKFADMAGFGGLVDPGSFTGGGADSARAWIQAAMAITGTNPAFLGGLMTIAKKESGFNPRAINLWDINAKRGIPSKGLFQTIDPTFNQHKMPGMGDIYNPIHNAVAAIRYMNSRYGGIGNVPGLRNMAGGKGYVGYAKGGFKDNNLDKVVVGEDGPEIVDLPFGSRVHNNRKTNELLQGKGQNVYNFSPVVNVNVQANEGETSQNVIKRAVNEALEEAFREWRGLMASGVEY